MRLENKLLRACLPGLFLHTESLCAHIKTALGGVRGTKSIQVHLGRPGERKKLLPLLLDMRERASLSCRPKSSSPFLHSPPCHTYPLPLSKPLHIKCVIIMVAWSAIGNGTSRRRGDYERAKQ